MLYYLLETLYVLTCLLLLLVVLLQQGKGGDMASAFGARAGATVLTKASSVLGVLFMLGAIALGIIGQRGPSSLMGGLKAPAPRQAPAPVPAQPPASAPAQQQAPAPTPAPEKAPEKK